MKHCGAIVNSIMAYFMCFSIRILGNVLSKNKFEFAKIRQAMPITVSCSFTEITTSISQQKFYVL